MAEREWLDVPYSKNKLAKSLGAKWDWQSKRWYAPQPGMTELEQWKLRPPVPAFLFKEDRFFGDGLFVDLVPKSCWFTNVRFCVSETDWMRIHRMVTSRAVDECEICGSTLHLEAHERFDFNDSSRTQTLKRLICLCKACHLSTHLGYAKTQGQSDQAFAHLMTVNKWTEDKAIQHVKWAFKVWAKRSQVAWDLDISMLSGTGVTVARTPEAAERRDQADQRTRSARLKEGR